MTLLFTNELKGGPWLEDARNATVSISAFISSKLDISSYKGYINYGISDNFNIELSSMCEPEKIFFTNDISLKAKLAENYFEDSDYILSAQLFTKNIITSNDFNFMNNGAGLLAGIKFGSMFATFEPSIRVDSKNYYLEIYLSVGYDYSEYSTIIFAKILSSVDERWKISLVKNLLGNLDMSTEYSHHINNDDKFNIGLWYRIR